MLTTSIFAVATPGKLLCESFPTLETLVCDEGDRILEMPDAAPFLRAHRRAKLVFCSATTGRLEEIGTILRSGDAEFVVPENL